jgi:hypothetical protein
MKIVGRLLLQLAADALVFPPTPRLARGYRRRPRNQNGTQNDDDVALARKCALACAYDRRGFERCRASGLARGVQRMQAWFARLNATNGKLPPDHRCGQRPIAGGLPPREICGQMLALQRGDLLRYNAFHELAGVPEYGYFQSHSSGGRPMIRLNVFASMLAVGIASLGSQAMAQSPNPALLAPSGGRAGLAPAHTVPRTHHTSPRPGGTPANMRSQRGHHLSHPRAHGL